MKNMPVYLICKKEEMTHIVKVEEVDLFMKKQDKWEAYYSGEWYVLKDPMDEVSENMGDDFYFAGKTLCINLYRVVCYGKNKFAFEGGAVLELGKNGFYSVKKQVELHAKKKR